MKLLVLALLVLCVCDVYAGHACSGWENQDRLQTGVLQLVNERNLEQLCYTVNVKYDIPKSGAQVAVGTLDLNGYSSSYGLDYSVRAKQSEFGNSVSLALLVHDKSWTKVDVSYLVTSRSDVLAGSFIADTFPLFGCDKKSTDSGVVKHSLPALAQGKYQIAAFISGLKTRDSQHKIKIQASVNSEFIVVTIVSTSYPLIENLHIDFVLVSVLSPLTLTRITDLAQSTSEYAIAGAIEIGVSTVRKISGISLGTNRLTCIGYGCPRDCVTVEECKDKNGIIRKDQCIICSIHEKFWGEKCVPNCGQNEQFDNGFCRCKPGFENIKGRCVTVCRDYEDWDGKRCFCVDGYARHLDSRKCKYCPPHSRSFDEKCVCEVGFEWSEYEWACVPVCHKTQVWNGKKCVCQSDLARFGDYCKPCPLYSKVFDEKCVCETGFQWNYSQWACQAKCKPWEIWNGKKCVCEKGYARNTYGECKICPEGSTAVNEKCFCPKNYEWNQAKWQCIYVCGANEIWNGKICVCQDGFARYGGQCKPCPLYSQAFNEKCICEKNYVWNDAKWACTPSCGQWEEWAGGKCGCKSGCGRHSNYCKPCPTYSKPFNQKCICETGYQMIENDWTCAPQCGDKQYWNGKACVCKEGYVQMNGQCKTCPVHSSYFNGRCECQQNFVWNGPHWCCDPQGPVCPPRSTWNQKKLVCECNYSSQYLIDGLCRRCGVNEGWNGQECVCVSNYYRIKGVCRTCDPNSNYNGRDCVCNHGFFGNADKCSKCHPSCGQCQGPKENQCLTCSDVSYDLINGYCKRDIPCPTGLFLDHDTCKPCSSYCANCESESVCQTCIEGFELQKLNFMGVVASYCSEICGDGKRFEVDCDDGNTRSGDGCNKYCEVQKDWHCQGGSSIKASTCVPFTPDRSFITTTGTVHLFGKVVQGVRLSYIPPELTKNECALCSKILWVRVIDSTVVPGVRIIYLPKSKYQFMAEFQFNGLLAIPVFSISIQINPDYAKYFNSADMAQIQVKKIDPATLKKKDRVDELSLDEVYSDDIVQSVFGGN